MQSGESLFYLLLSIAVVIAQCVLGMGDWCALSVQWLLGRVIAAGIVYCISANRLATRSINGLLPLSWVIIASILNLSTIHLASPMLWWQQDLLLTSFTAVFLLSTGSWLSTDDTPRFLLCGSMIGLSTVIYAESAIWLLAMPFFMFCLRNFTMRNFLSIVSGAIFMAWISYCVMLFAVSDDCADAYLMSFAGIMDWHFPDRFIVISQLAFTPMLFLIAIAVMLFWCVTNGLFVNVVSSLRIRSVMLASVCAVAVIMVLAAVDPVAYPLFICMAGVFVSMNLCLTMANMSAPATRWWSVIVAVGLILLGFAENVINYLLTL